MEELALVAALLSLPVTVLGLVRWRAAFAGLLVFLPFAGVVTLALYPADLPKLFKDALFVVPALAGFVLARNRSEDVPAVGFAVVAAMATFAALVVAQTLNPALASTGIAVIGLKIWLLYVPLAFLAAAYLRSYRDLVAVMRLLTVLAVLPCTLGLVQWALSATIGYGATMQWFYGAAARGATQGFQRFADYGGLFYRVPSTFTFAAQYSYFALAMLVPTYVVMVSDPSARWRTAGRLVFALVVAAGILSGARGNVLLVPMTIALVVVLDGRFSTGASIGLVLPVLVTGAALAGGLDPFRLFEGVADLVGHHGRNVVLGSLGHALDEYPFGLGTGMGAVAARHVAGGDRTVVLENFYAKSVVEFGIAGLVVVAVLFGTILARGLGVLRRTAATPLRAPAAALLSCLFVFVASSGKGFALEIDPMNVLFWVYTGFLMKLPYLMTHVVRRSAPQPAMAPRYAWR